MCTKKAIDPGFGGIKVAWVDQGQIKTGVIPSVVGIGRVGDMGMLGLGRQRRAERPLTVHFDNIQYLVGENIHRYTTPIEELDHTRLSEGLVNRSLIYAALGTSFNGNGYHAGDDLAVMLGFPVEIMLNKPKAKDTLRTVKRWLIGPHEFAVDDRPFECNINQVRAIAQPVGAYFDWGLDVNGEWIRETEALKLPVAVCDVGYHTVDLFAVEGGEVTDRFTKGDNLGMHRVARVIRTHVREQYGIDAYSLHQADALVRQHIAGQPAVLYCDAGRVDLSGLIDQALEQAYTAIGDFIKDNWQSGKQFYRIIITGGGGQALRHQFLRHYPSAYLPADSVVANARGLLKWALRQGVFK